MHIMSDKYSGYMRLLSCLDRVSDVILIGAPFDQDEWNARCSLVKQVCVANQVTVQKNENPMHIEIKLGNDKLVWVV